MTKIILNFVTVEPNNDTDSNRVIWEEYPVAAKYAYNLLKSNKKHKMPILMALQFVPTDTWAEYLFKGIDENSISQDYDGTYVLNLFVRTLKHREIYYDFSAISKALVKAAEKIKDTFGDDYELVIYADEQFWKVKRFIFGQINKNFGKRCEVINLVKPKQNDKVERENDNFDYSDWEYDDDDDEEWL